MTFGDRRPIDSTCVVQRSRTQAHCQVGELIVLMNVETGEYFELNRVGSRVWQEVESAVRIHDVVDRLQNIFDVDRSTCEAEVLDWVGKMQTLGLLEVTRGHSN